MKIRTDTSLYLSATLLLVFALSFWAGLRGLDDADTEVYLLFYQKLIDEGIIGIQSCQSFEPLFCGLSLVASYALGSSILTQYFWVFLYFSVTLRAFSLLYGLAFPDNKFRFVAVLYFAFIAINYVDPQIVFFLTRQYIASAFLMLGFAKIAGDKNPSINFLIATLIHFAAFPIALIAYIFSRRFELRWQYAIPIFSLVFLFFYFMDSYIFEVYFESLRYKVMEYSDKNDGTVTLTQELKLFIYWGLSIWFFLRSRVRLVLALIFIYLFYLGTGFNELIHLRYYKYLESMSWPSALMFAFLFKRDAPCIIAAALSLRIYKYLTLISPESSIFYLLVFLAGHVLSLPLSLLGF